MVVLARLVLAAFSNICLVKTELRSNGKGSKYSVLETPHAFIFKCPFCGNP